MNQCSLFQMLKNQSDCLKLESLFFNCCINQTVNQLMKEYFGLQGIIRKPLAFRATLLIGVMEMIADLSKTEASCFGSIFHTWWSNILPTSSLLRGWQPSFEGHCIGLSQLNRRRRSHRCIHHKQCLPLDHQRVAPCGSRFRSGQCGAHQSLQLLSRWLPCWHAKSGCQQVFLTC